MSNNLIDLTGKRFGRLVVLGRAENRGKSVMWLCKCDCGNEHITYGECLKHGSSTSCGCYSRKVHSETNRTHGANGTRLYRVWSGMKRRCYNPKTDSYSKYGGRGIKVCEEWANSFGTFQSWALANGYDDGLSIDRINPDGNYCPDNCRWATPRQQTNNRRNTIMLTFNGETMPLSEWAEHTGIAAPTIEARLKRGWSVEKTMTTPVKKEHR